MSHLRALQYFLEAAESLSIRQAADRLHVSSGAISKQIRLLEEHLSVSLFNRTPSGVTLTSAGERLLSLAGPHMRGLQQALVDFYPNPNKPLVVSCEPTFSMQWLIPRLSDFYASHEGVPVSVLASGGPIDLYASGVDIAIRRQDFDIPNTLLCTPFLEEKLGPVMTTSYYETYIENDERITLLIPESRKDLWTKHRPFFPERKKCVLAFGHFYQAIVAARQGLGILLAPQCLVQQEIDSGELISPWGFEETQIKYVLITRKNETGLSNQSFMSNSLNIFKEWLLSLP